MLNTWSNIVSTQTLKPSQSWECKTSWNINTDWILSRRGGLMLSWYRSSLRPTDKCEQHSLTASQVYLHSLDSEHEEPAGLCVLFRCFSIVLTLKKCNIATMKQHFRDGRIYVSLLFVLKCCKKTHIGVACCYSSSLFLVRTFVTTTLETQEQQSLCYNSREGV